MKKIVSILLILALLCGLCACGDDDERYIFYPLSVEPQTLDPQVCGDADTALVVSQMYEGLVRMGEDGSIRPGVAKSMEVSDDGMTYTFHLREDAHWHIIKNFKDIFGEGCEKNLELPVTAEDFVFAFQRIFSPHTGTPGADTLYAIRNAKAVHTGEMSVLELGVKAADPQTLVITLERAGADFLTLLTQPICMPCHRLFFESTKGKYGLGLAYTMCNGPFSLYRWMLGTSITLKRNPDYIGELAVIPAGVSLLFNSDKSTYVQKVSEDKYDAAPVERELAVGIPSGLRTVEVHNTVWGLAFQCTDPLLSNAYLRMALCSAFSAGTLAIENVTPAQGMLPSACRVGGEKYRDLAGGAELPEESTARAQLFMQFALKELGASTISFTILCLQEHETPMRRVIQNWQKVFGVAVSAKTQVVTQTELLAARGSGAFQAAFLPVQAPFTSAVQCLYSFVSDSAIRLGLEESTAEYSALISAALTAPTAAAAAACCRQAESYLIRTGVFYPVYEDVSRFVVRGNVEGVQFTPCGEAVSFITARKSG